MAPMASNEGRSGTEVGLWALLSTMPTGAIITSIRCSQTVCSGPIVDPPPARLVSANRGHYTLACRRHSNRIGQESHDDVYTPAVHA
ncbi:hypothetical protein BKA70DRAFT_1424564 [Coprinopsis sp. MPI-PUGE-AT-0042]|nr:hypothetical protein BKA70DRAFT_1424564 [Coprinopsis sp. MPI-PUGE-AT-0042]